MEVSAAVLPWKRCIYLVVLLVQLSLPGVTASCRILRCNSDFVAATLELGSSSAAGGATLSREAANTIYCSALRSYATCTKRTARTCRGDLAYHSAVQGIEDLLIQHRCPQAGPTAQTRPLPLTPISRDDCLYEKGFFKRDGEPRDYLHCSIFGDPHIRTFNDDFQTCALQGAWPLLDNDYLYIQATSTRLKAGAHATALTKITIIFKNVRQCIEQQLYQAELDNVPAAFTDGSVSSGERRGQHGLLVYTHSPGRHAEIQANHIGIVLVVRQSGRSLGLAVRSPRAIVEAFAPEQDLQLCMWGCPASQRLNIFHLPPSSPSSTSSAQAHCAARLPVRDVYYQACVFDLLTAGDLNASSAAVDALEDARRMIPDPESVHLLPVGSSGRHTSGIAVPLVLLGLMTSLMGLGSRPYF